MPPLYGSLNLADFREDFLKFSNINFVGKKDKIIPFEITLDFTGNVIIADNAGHAEGFEEIYPLIWEEN